MTVTVKVQITQKPEYDYGDDNLPVYIHRETDRVVIQEENSSKRLVFDFYDLKKAIEKLEEF